MTTHCLLVDADRDAPFWMGFARGVAKATPRPSTYEVEDWEAEAYLALAKALKALEAGGAEKVIRAHLGRTIREHLFHDCTMRALGMRGSKDNIPRPEFSRVATRARTWSMDESTPGSEDTGDSPLTRHDMVADPNAPDPLDETLGADLKAAIMAWGVTTTPTRREHLGFMLDEVPRHTVAALMGVSTNAVSDIRKRIRAELRDYLNARGFACP